MVAIMNFILVTVLVSSTHAWTFDYDDNSVLNSKSDESNFDNLPTANNGPDRDPANDQHASGNVPGLDLPVFKPKEADPEPEIENDDVHNLPIFDSKDKIEEGRQRYEIIKAEAPKYGTCWTNAIQSLHVGCSRLNDESQARMGLSFANCFLEKVGSKTYPCTINRDIKSCVQSMDDRAFNTYTHFYTHTQSICFFLANQVWQESTSQVVHKLSDTSAKVSERLVHLQDLQEQSIETQFDLNVKMTESKTTLEHFGQSLKEKQIIETEILKRFLEIKEFILTELSKFYSIGFYLLAIVTVYLITTPVRTSSARFWVLLLFAGNLAIERYVVSNVLTTDGQITFDTRGIRDVSSEIDESTWICRKATCLIATIVIFIFWISYKDYGQMNHMLLSQIRDHNLDLKKSASEIKSLQFLQLQRMGLSAESNVHVCPSVSDQDSDEEVEVVEPPKSNLDVMSDFSDLDSGHEDGPLDEADSVSRIKTALKPVKFIKKESRTPSKNVTVNQSHISIYSPRTTYNLRERKTSATTRSALPETPSKTEFSDRDWIWNRMKANVAKPWLIKHTIIHRLYKLASSFHDP